MYCRNCGNPMADNAIACPNCGVARMNGHSYCPNCGAPTDPNAMFCTKCGVGFQKINNAQESEKSKLTAGLLGIFLGGFGVHRFYLGYTGIGIAQIIVTIITFGVGSLWGFIEGILILCGVINKDAHGNPLKD